MAQDTINKMFEAAKMRLKTEHDSMIENIKEDLLNYSRKTLIKTEHL
ncbi:MAG TPA: hypothetical protein VE818_01365 [Nitrososphaeraceae archaeon]|jgi:hypothetical protein|nr:hypothetical protein [Nitrososphaeraceae archaeon]